MLRDGKLNEKKDGETKQAGGVPGVFTLGKLPTLILINWEAMVHQIIAF